MQPTIVFILSSWHSGSTWLGYVLGSGPESAFVGEYYRAWTRSIRQPCMVCAARGLERCEVLYDIEGQIPEKAFDFAASRTGRRVIVDSSKAIHWIQQFDRVYERHDMRLLFIFRDPRGYYSSTKRRGRGDVDDVIAHWCRENRDFRDFARASGIPNLTVSYDLLASAPLAQFRRLFQFCDMSFSEEALAYWNFEHHGFAANGASDALLKERGFMRAPEHFVTGDDAYYREKSKTMFHDQRWRTALSPSESRAIQRNQGVRELLESLGFELTDTGVARKSTMKCPFGY